MGIAEDRELDRQLTECLRNGPTVHLVNDPAESEPVYWPLGYIQGDPNKTREEIPHPTPVLDALRAAIANPETSDQDRGSARECLRVSFHE
jgi:hypothetical protein